MAINLDIKSLLKRTLNQWGPVFFSKIEIKGTFVSASHWRVCLGHGRVMRVCERCVSARLFAFETFLREYSCEFMLHRRKFTINLGLFPRTKKKIYTCFQNAYRSNHIVKWQKKMTKKWESSQQDIRSWSPAQFLTRFVLCWFTVPPWQGPSNVQEILLLLLVLPPHLLLYLSIQWLPARLTPKNNRCSL